MRAGTKKGKSPQISLSESEQTAQGRLQKGLPQIRHNQKADQTKNKADQLVHQTGSPAPQITIRPIHGSEEIVKLMRLNHHNRSKRHKKQADKNT